MSYYVACVGVVRIKDELKDDFESFFNGDYDKISNPIIKEFVDYYHDGIDDDFHVCEIKYWKHDNEKSEWVGKYKTEYKDGILTYGVSYNSYGSHAEYIEECWALIRIISQEKIFYDSWCEPT